MVDIVSASPNGIGNPPNMASGVFTGSGNPASLVLGFTPRYVFVMDETLNITYEKVQGTTPANTYKTVAAGTKTVDTSSLITFPADTGLNEPGSSVLLAAGVAANASKLVWYALG